MNVCTWKLLVRTADIIASYPVTSLHYNRVGREVKNDTTWSNQTMTRCLIPQKEPAMERNLLTLLWFTLGNYCSTYSTEFFIYAHLQTRLFRHSLIRFSADTPSWISNRLSYSDRFFWAIGLMKLNSVTRYKLDLLEEPYLEPRPGLWLLLLECHDFATVYSWFRTALKCGAKYSWLPDFLYFFWWFITRI